MGKPTSDLNNKLQYSRTELGYTVNCLLYRCMVAKWETMLDPMYISRQHAVLYSTYTDQISAQVYYNLEHGNVGTWKYFRH